MMSYLYLSLFWGVISMALYGYVLALCIQGCADYAKLAFYLLGGYVADSFSERAFDEYERTILKKERN